MMILLAIIALVVATTTASIVWAAARYGALIDQLDIAASHEVDRVE